MGDEGQVSSQQGEPEPVSGGGNEQGGLTAEQMAAEIRKLRDENAARRTKAKELEAQLQALSDEKQQRDERDLTAQQKLERELAEARQKLEAQQAALKEASLRSLVAQEARKLNMVDEDAAFRLMDASKVAYEGDAPQNVADVLRQLAEQKPWLVNRPTAGGPTNPARPGSLPSLDEVRRLPQEEINKLWDSGVMQQVLAQQS